ncbi:hypothetical protein [Dechloromonas denitrificans]|uniref:hypothetical protein n=1 Tax=Dechloromonas denitrificans TaxID=281362 RepID=UPI0012F8D0B6|nr:hypothetical protein [Dechloromonas denitrificans]
MESPRTGIAILALLAAATGLGAALGWQLRSPQHIPEAKLAPPVGVPPDVRPGSDGSEYPGATNAIQPVR